MWIQILIHRPGAHNEQLSNYRGIIKALSNQQITENQLFTWLPEVISFFTLSNIFLTKFCAVLSMAQLNNITALVAFIVEKHRKADNTIVIEELDFSNISIRENSVKLFDE